MAAPLFLSLSHFLSTSASFHLFYFLFFFYISLLFRSVRSVRRLPPATDSAIPADHEAEGKDEDGEREREKEREAMASRRPTSSTASPSTSGHRNRPTFIGSVNTAVIAGVRRDVAKKKSQRKTRSTSVPTGGNRPFPRSRLATKTIRSNPLQINLQFPLSYLVKPPQKKTL